MHADGELKPLKILIESLTGNPLLNLAAANEHVPEIKIRTRVMKEQCRSTLHGLPFQRMPKFLITHIVLNSVKTISLFQTKGGISDNISLKTIMLGETLDYKKAPISTVSKVLPSARGG